jgi:hypothetical protein
LLSLELANSALISTSISLYLAGGGFAYKKTQAMGVVVGADSKIKKT